MDDPPPLNEANVPTDGLEQNGDARREYNGYWCYQCNKEVITVREEAGLEGSTSAGLVCAECRNGFIEVMTTAQQEFEPAPRRRRRARGATRAHTVDLSEALEHLHPHQLMQLVQLLREGTQSSNMNVPAGDENDVAGFDTPEVIQPPRSSTPDSWEERADEDIQENLGESHPAGHSSLMSGQAHQTALPASGEETMAHDQDSFIPSTGAVVNEPISEDHHHISDDRNLRRIVFVRQRDERHIEGDDNFDVDDELDDGDDNSLEERLQLELERWHSGSDDDPEEWAEVDDDEIDNADDEIDASAPPAHQSSNNLLDIEASDASYQGVTNEGQEATQQRRHPQVQEQRNLRFRVRNVEENLHHYLLELLQNMVGQDVEVRVELPDGPMYVGNPGDYVDAREFEQLLQQLAENDDSQLGAPPAAKSAVDGLPSVTIEQPHLNEGTAVCPVCKDMIALGECAKQLPCLHLYHADCILPWLNTRNSCPMCRYELPTDDPDYEEQRKKRDRPQSSSTRPNDQSYEETSCIAEHAQEGSGEATAEASDMVVNGGGNVTEAMENNLENMNMVQEHEIEQENDGLLVIPHNRPERMQGTRRGWIQLAAGPVLSMVGIMLVVCLGSHVLGGGLRSNGRIRGSQQNNFFGENHIEQRGLSSEVQSRRHWWMPFQR